LPKGNHNLSVIAFKKYVKRFRCFWAKFFHFFCRLLNMVIKGCAIVDRIDALLCEKGKQRKQLALDLNFSVANISKWKNKGSLPEVDTAAAIADYLGVSIGWLLTGKDEQGLSRDERNVVAMYRRLTDDNQRVIQVTLDAMLSVPEVGKKEVPA
jgi:transcriptional regulator with XRE-family HTH domain